jgi:hypothetical protein
MDAVSQWWSHGERAAACFRPGDQIVTAQHNDYTGPESSRRGKGITDQVPERFLYTIPPVTAKRLHVAHFTGPDHP